MQADKFFNAQRFVTDIKLHDKDYLFNIVFNIVILACISMIATVKSVTPKKNTVVASSIYPIVFIIFFLSILNN